MNKNLTMIGFGLAASLLLGSCKKNDVRPDILENPDHTVPVTEVNQPVQNIYEIDITDSLGVVKNVSYQLSQGSSAISYDVKSTGTVGIKPSSTAVTEANVSKANSRALLLTNVGAITISTTQPNGSALNTPYAATRVTITDIGLNTQSTVTNAQAAATANAVLANAATWKYQK